MSLGNVTKYPLSLQFVLMTVGPALVFLGFPAWKFEPLLALGRAPMFFYVAHLYLLHAVALLWAMAKGLAPLPLSVKFGGIPDAFGFPLWVTLPFALAVTAVLVPACNWYARQRKSYPILRYF